MDPPPPCDLDVLRLRLADGLSINRERVWGLPLSLLLLILLFAADAVFSPLLVREELLFRRSVLVVVVVVFPRCRRSSFSLD